VSFNVSFIFVNIVHIYMVSIIPRLRDTTGCQTGYTTGLSNWLYNRIDNRLYRVDKHPTSCQAGLITGWMFVYTIQPVDKVSK